jgi:hypothetical protein
MTQKLKYAEMKVQKAAVEMAQTNTEVEKMTVGLTRSGIA